MKVKNEYVQIQVGNKVYTKRNMILNKYLNRIFVNQINPSYTTRNDITNCYLKLDTPLQNIDYDSELSSSDFDIVLQSSNKSIIDEEKIFNSFSTKTKDGIIVSYKFTNDGDFQYKENRSWKNGKQNEFNRFSGRKVTAIGFSSKISGILAVVDVSNMNIIINQNEEFIVSRVDRYQSDAICNGFEYPLHLVNFNAKYNARYDSNTGRSTCTMAQLYSIGLGNKIGLMESEHIIDFDEATVGNNNIELEFSDLIKVGHYPSETLFPSVSLFPKKDNSRYIILKYRLLDINDLSSKTYLDKYYTMNYRYDLSKYNNQTKNILFNLKIERM